MRKTLLATAIALLTVLPLRVLAATPSEFHASLLRRGISAYEGGRHQEAVKSLRLAAFGMIEAIDQYETAHAYLALTYDKLKDTERARDSLRKVVQAERVEKRFGSIAFPPDVRAAVLALAARLMTAAEAETLRSSPGKGTPSSSPAGPAASPPPVTQPQTTTTAPPRTSGGATPPSQPAKTPAPPEKQPAVAAPKPGQPQPVPKPGPGNNTPSAPPPRSPTPPTTPLSASDVANRFLAAERALTASNLNEARRIYREMLSHTLARESYIRIAEGCYRARDFAGALAAFDRAGTLRRGEEPYRFYIAVAAFESGQLERARRELAAALPFIEITPDVARYKAKIEGALN